MPTWAKGLIVAFVVVVVLGITGAAFLSTRQQPTGGDVLPPPPPPPPPTYSWHPVTSFSGSEDKTTDSFQITGSKFRVFWTATAENEFGLFTLYVYEVGHTLWSETVFVSWDSAGTKSDDTVIFDSGEFYLDIGGANLSSWSVSVEEWR